MGNFGGRDDHCKVYGFPAISYAKPAELIKTPIGMLSQVDAKNHVLDRGTDPPCEGQIDGKGMPQHVRRHFSVNCAETAEAIKMPFGL